MPLSKEEIYLRSAIRKVWRWTSAERRAIKKKAECASCGKKGLKGKSLHVDHVIPAVDPTTGFKDWNTYIERMMRGPLQGLCVPCHKKKTAAESKVRRKKKKEKPK